MGIEEELQDIAENLIGNTGEKEECMRYCSVTGEEFIKVEIRYNDIKELKQLWKTWIKEYITRVRDNIGELTLYWRIEPSIHHNFMRARLLITTKRGR